MANTFKRYISREIGTSETSIGSYTVGSSTQTTVIGLVVSNISSSQILIDATIKISSDSYANPYYLIKQAPVPVGGSLVIVGGDQKVLLETGDRIYVTSDTATSADAVMSILEIT